MSFVRSQRVGTDLTATLAVPLMTNRRVLGAAMLSVVTYIGLIPSAFLKYSAQMPAVGLDYADNAMPTPPANTYATIGSFGLGLTVAYAVFTSVALTNIVIQLRLQDISDIRDFISIVPGLLTSGRASYGSGVLGWFGFAGTLAAMPFDGNLLRLKGILLFLARSDDSRTCEVR